MAESNTKATASFPVFSILLLVFVLCKAFEYGPIASWSWFWVLSPVWIGGIAAFVLEVLTGLVTKK